MVRSGEPDKDEEANERMNSVYPLVNALHSIYMDDPAFNESVESGVLYSTVLPGSGNIIAGKAVLIRNFVDDIGHAYIMDLGIKSALGYNPRTTTDWKGDRPSTRIGSIAMLRDNFIKAKKNAKTFGYWKENYRRSRTISRSIYRYPFKQKQTDGTSSQ